jgi:hypothetical protein
LSDEILDGLDKKSRAKVAANLSLLEEEGPHLKRPYADVVRGKIRELRIREALKDPEFKAHYQEERQALNWR